MTSFHNGQRVEVVEPTPEHHALKGKAGTIVRLLRRSTYGAWVEMDDELPPEIRQFPIDDGRSRHVLLFLDEVEEEMPF